MYTKEEGRCFYASNHTPPPSSRPPSPLFIFANIYSERKYFLKSTPSPALLTELNTPLIAILGNWNISTFTAAVSESDKQRKKSVECFLACLAACKKKFQTNWFFNNVYNSINIIKKTIGSKHFLACRKTCMKSLNTFFTHNIINHIYFIHQFFSNNIFAMYFADANIRYLTH